ncbi:MAG: DUF362 domain-containing protein [Candidatus Zipacnadales bacterium]
MNSRYLVVVQPCSNYALGTIRQAVRDCLTLGGLPAYLQPGTTVLLKPNIASPRVPESAICTHPTVVRAVAEFIYEAGCQVIVADQPTFALAPTPDRVLDPTGYKNALRGIPAEICLLGRDGYEPVTVSSPFRMSRVHVSRLYRSVNTVINLAKCKTHIQTTLSLALKNTFGAIAPRDRLRIHALGSYRGLAEGIADCFSATVPEFNLVDGVMGMDGPGPTQGTPRHLGFIAASPHAVALDLVVESLVGMEGQVGLTEIMRTKFGPPSADDISIIGANPADLRIPIRRPPMLGRSFPRLFGPIGERLLYIRPRVHRGRCLACGGCAQACPVGAIRIANYAFIDRNKCVECFCCTEACPVDAISVDRSLLARVFAKG